MITLGSWGDAGWGCGEPRQEREGIDGWLGVYTGGIGVGGWEERWMGDLNLTLRSRGFRH